MCNSLVGRIKQKIVIHQKQYSRLRYSFYFLGRGAEKKMRPRIVYPGPLAQLVGGMVEREIIAVYFIRIIFLTSECVPALSW